MRRSLVTSKWVFFKEDSSSHGERYIARIPILHGGDPFIEMTEHVCEAFGFETAAEAYALGAKLAPLIDNMRVGLRG